MTIIEAAAKAHSEANGQRWEGLSKASQEHAIMRMRAALRAIAECEPSELMQEIIARASTDKLWPLLMTAVAGEE